MALPTRKVQLGKPNSLPKEFLRTIHELFHKQFKTKLQGSEFLVYADLYPDEVVFCVSLTNPKSLRAASLYLSAGLAKNLMESPEKLTEQLKSMVDVGASWFAQAFEEGEGLEAALAAMEETSGEWESFPWEEQTLYAKLNRDNHALEHMTDKLLHEAGMGDEDEPSDAELEELLAEIEEEEEKKFH